MATRPRPPRSGRRSRARAEIAVDGWFFRIDGHDEAEKAVAALDPASWTAQLLTGRLAYSRLLFQHAPRPGDRAASEAAYRAAAGSGDELQRGWAEYHWGVLLDNIDEDTTGAVARYEVALEIATKYGDGFFESYIIRHLAHLEDPAEGIAMLRRSLHLRAARAGHRSLAAQAALANDLPEDDPERAELIRIYRPAADELRIGWLKPTAERADDPRVRRERRTCVIDRAHRMNRHIGAACSQRSRTGVGVGGHHVGVLRTAVEIHGHPRCPVATDLVGCTDRPEKLAVGCRSCLMNAGVNSFCGVSGSAATMSSSECVPSNSPSTVAAYGAWNTSRGSSYSPTVRFQAVIR